MKGLKAYIIIASVLLIAYVVAQYNRPAAINWTPTYSSADKIPFGSYILYSRLHDIFPKAKVVAYKEPLYNLIVDDSLANSAIIIVADNINIDEYDYKQLTKYINKGNDVFISAAYFGAYFKKKLKLDTDSEEEKNGQSYVNFTSKALTDSSYLVDKNSTNGYFSEFDTLKTEVIGGNGYNHATFLRITMGKGNLYLNANPQLFTNYSILQLSGASYAAKALSFLKEEKNLAWNEYYTKGRDGEESTMRVFLSHPPLRWAFYIVGFSLLLFIVYQSKRRQRIIPIIEPVTNTSVEFATVVGQVYYEQRDNSNIAKKKASYFLEHIRVRYYLKTNILDTDFIKSLSQKSGAELSLVQQLCHQITIIQSGQPVSNNELISLNQNIEQFYQQAS